MEDTVHLLETRIGYTFTDKNLAATALTHSSFSNENKARGVEVRCNDRLEFLGDSENHDLFEGDLTKIRAGVVCENALYDYAKEIGLGELLRLGRGEENTGGRNRKSILSDAFEAVIAAVYLDGGFEKAQSFVLPFVTKAANALMQSGSTEDYKTLLQKFIQHNRGDIREYAVTNESGPSHKRTFEVQVSLNNNVIGSGFGSSKREAEQMAAKEALRLFGEVGVDA